ncbi:MAG: DNA translocase FtsK 4TM domain-containing protein [candidate division Zixibacteria bacterium]|nr:DNA translocase FtsK 4TM domain-containing protein [candidate division Zixibacteria bacterium]
MASRKNKNGNGEKKRKLLGILLILFAALLFISLVTHSEWDDRRITSQDNPLKTAFRNQVGVVGAYTSYLFFFFFGWLSIFVPFMLVLGAFRLLNFSWRKRINPAFWFGCSTCILVTLMTDVYLIHHAGMPISYPDTNGGYLGFYFSLFFIKIVGSAGSFVILGTGIIAWLVVLGYKYTALTERLGMPFAQALTHLGNWAKTIPGRIWEFVRDIFRRESREEEDWEEAPRPASPPLEPLVAYSVSGASEYDNSESIEETKRQKSKRKVTIAKKAAPIGIETKDYKFPGLDLLTDNPEPGLSVSPDELAFTARSLKDTLETFGVRIEGEIEKHPGPVITRYEFKPSAGVKVHQITNLSDDLALALKARRIRIVAPIPGKAAVGVEIPNRNPRMVYLKDILASEQYGDARLRLPLALGKTISGKPFAADLAKMPHLLIAGATGSGKSVCINVLITSLMYRLHPKQLKFIFIDPKMLELTMYGGIPHLGRPVVTNPKRAEKVLSDAVVEMEKRYKRLAGQAVRNIEDFNARQKNEDDKIPYIVIVVDELADMMMAASSSRIEMLITRLAQMARAVGIHLILATQRPSVDVITGLIKANFPARIAFQVASRIDSRTILDGNGAEKLLGNGDMLYLASGQPEPVRLHGPYLAGQETEGLVKFIVDQFPQMVRVESEPDDDAEEVEDALDLDDPIFVEAAQTVVRHKQGSVSLLQRKLGIGYQRAARLIDKLESAGIVSAYDGSKAREVLVDKAHLEQLLSARSLTDLNS